MSDTKSQIYLFNSPVMTGYGTWQFEGPLSVERARELLKGGFTSAVGHPETAKFLSELLEIPVPVNRITAQLQVGDGTDRVSPTSHLFFLRTDVPLSWRWRGETSLRVDTGSQPGVLVPLRGACSLLIEDPAEFHRQILQGLESLESDHLTRILDTLVRTQIESRLAPLVERGALDAMRAQILLGDLAATDLNEDLHDLGLRCIHLAAFTPAVEHEPVTEVPVYSAPSGSYDDVL